MHQWQRLASSRDLHGLLEARPLGVQTKTDDPESGGAGEQEIYSLSDYEEDGTCAEEEEEASNRQKKSSKKRSMNIRRDSMDSGVERSLDLYEEEERIKNNEDGVNKESVDAAWGEKANRRNRRPGGHGQCRIPPSKAITSPDDFTYNFLCSIM